MEPPESLFTGKQNEAKRQRMMAAYLVEPSGWLGRWKQRRAERWLVADSMGPAGTSLYDTRKQQDEIRERWRQWRAAELGKTP
jgi:hypothetical protein